MPRLQALNAEFGSEGLAIVAVNKGDSAEVIRRYMRDARLGFTPVLNGKGNLDATKLFGVRSFPSNFVLDQRGIVVARMLGFEGKTIRKALADLGIGRAPSL